MVDTPRGYPVPPRDIRPDVQLALQQLASAIDADVESLDGALEALTGRALAAFGPLANRPAVGRFTGDAYRASDGEGGLWLWNGTGWTRADQRSARMESLHSLDTAGWVNLSPSGGSSWTAASATDARPRLSREGSTVMHQGGWTGGVAGSVATVVAAQFRPPRILSVPFMAFDLSIGFATIFTNGDMSLSKAVHDRAEFRWSVIA